GVQIAADLIAGLLEVKNNTSCFNGGSGFVSNCVVGYGRYECTGNVGAENGGYGMRWAAPEVSAVGCNDWFGNSLGDVQGLPPSSEDVALDPLFCRADSGDFHLQARSHLVNRAGCGVIGALGVGCDVTATTVSRFGGERVADGIRIVWELGPHAMASAVW